MLNNPDQFKEINDHNEVYAAEYIYEETKNERSRKNRTRNREAPERKKNKESAAA